MERREIGHRLEQRFDLPIQCHRLPIFRNRVDFNTQAPAALKPITATSVSKSQFVTSAARTERLSESRSLSVLLYWPRSLDRRAGACGLGDFLTHLPQHSLDLLVEAGAVAVEDRLRRCDCNPERRVPAA